MIKNSILLFLLTLWSCNDFPKDPNNTLFKIKGDTLKVGISNSGALSSYNDGNPSGEEVEIVKGFARTLNTKIVWVPGSQEHLVDLLSEYEIDIAIGGFTKKGPFKKHAGFTKPYKIEKIYLGAPQGMELPDDNIKKLRIGVEEGSASAVAIKKKGAIPVYYDSIPPENIYIAATEKELNKFNMQVGEDYLQKTEHVLAIPKGENALLMNLEKYVEKHGKR